MQLDTNVDLSFLAIASSTSSSPIRDNALHISGSPLAHLPTGKVFSYVTLFAPKPLGVEWINDTNLVVIFDDPQAAFLAFTKLSKTGFEPWEGGDEPLVDRAAQSVPLSLLPIPPLPPREEYEEAKTVDDDVPEGLRPGAMMQVRYAKMDDMKERKKAADSSFYKRYGRRAGKELAPSAAIARGLEEYSAEYPDFDDDLDNDRREGGEELLDAEEDAAGFRADQVEGSQDLLMRRGDGAIRAAHMDQVDDQSSRSDLLDGPPRTTRRLAMDEADEFGRDNRSRRHGGVKMKEDEFGREARPQRLADRMNIKSERGRDARELSPVRNQNSGLRGWDDEVKPASSLLDRLGVDERKPRRERDWDRDREGPVAGRRERDYEPRSDRRGRGGGGRGGERRERKNASDLDKELDEFLGRA